MNPGVSSADPLRVFLSGKRAHERQAVSIGVELGGVREQIAARCVDLSPGGALLAIGTTAIDRVRRRREDDLAVIQREFADGFDIRFPEQGVALEAHPVRLCLPPGEEDVLYLGCRFTEALSDRLVEKLGLRRKRSS